MTLAGHISVFLAAAIWYLLVSLQTVFVAHNKNYALPVNFATSLIWILLLRNLLLNIDAFALTYALGTTAGCAIGMKVAHAVRRRGPE